MRYGEAGQSHLLPFLGAAALFAALTIMAHSVVLGLAHRRRPHLWPKPPLKAPGLLPLSPKPPRQAASKAILWSFWVTMLGPKARAQ